MQFIPLMIFYLFIKSKNSAYWARGGYPLAKISTGGLGILVGKDKTNLGWERQEESWLVNNPCYFRTYLMTGAGTWKNVHPFVKNLLLDNLNIQAKDNEHGTYMIFNVLDVTFVAIYCPPAQSQAIESWLQSILTKHEVDSSNKIVILGDFNCRLRAWGDSTTNVGGVQLHRKMEFLGIRRLDTGGQPTFFNSKGSSIVDHVFSNIPWY